MAMWSSFEKDKLLTENWRKFATDNPEDKDNQTVYGLTSDKNPDSLKRLLSGVVEDDVAAQIINLIASAADDEGVMLEAVSLQGSKSEQDRVFSGETTREILQGLDALGLDAPALKKVVKVLNQWGKLNTVKFEKPATNSVPVDSPTPETPTPTAVPTPTPEPTPAPETTPVSEPDSAAEPSSPEPQAAEEPLKIITKILGEKGVDEEKVSAFINDLREMGVIQEMAPGALKRNLKMNKVEWVEFSQKHPEVIEAISQLRGRSKKARALQAQFKDALSGIIAREEEPPMPRIRRKKKSTAASKSKTDSTPAAVTPAEPAPQAVPEPAPAPEPLPPEPPPEPEPKRKKKTAPPIKNQKAYDHGKQGKAIGSKGTLLPNPVQDIEKAIFDLTRIKSNSDDQNFRGKIDSYIRGLYYFQDEKEGLNESLMLRWKTIAGIK